jgi:hypothetical protein
LGLPLADSIPTQLANLYLGDQAAISAGKTITPKLLGQFTGKGGMVAMAA